MAIPVGCRTDKTVLKFKNQLLILEQDWILHPTKGWRRGQKRKSVKLISGGRWHRRFTFSQSWSRKDW